MVASAAAALQRTHAPRSMLRTWSHQQQRLRRTPPQPMAAALQPLRAHAATSSSWRQWTLPLLSAHPSSPSCGHPTATAVCTMRCKWQALQAAPQQQQ
jgi:hypothetical protein